MRLRGNQQVTERYPDRGIQIIGKRRCCASAGAGAFFLLTKRYRPHPIKLRQIAVEHDFLATGEVDKLFGTVHGKVVGMSWCSGQGKWKTFTMDAFGVLEHD